MYIKKLIGEKCYLSPIDPNDAEIYATWLNDQEVTDYLNLATAVIPVEGEKEILQRLSRDHNYAIVDIKNNELLGNVGLVGVNHIHSTAEIGIFIGNKKYWSKGYGQEALSLFIDFCYRKLNLNNITLRTYSFNTRAIRCYEKVGFKKVGELREALRINLKEYNIILMDILPADFYKVYQAK